MAYNELLAAQIRERFKDRGMEITEKKMFGGLSFLYKGKMTIGIVKDKMAVRVLASKIDYELKKPKVSAMDFTKRPMKEFVFVEVGNPNDLDYWIDLGLEHARSKLK